MTTADISETFSFTRSFDAPRHLVWKAFTEVEHLKHWWGPKGFKMEHCELDFRPGGRFHYGMKSPGGQEMWGLFQYREIDAPERIVFTNSFSDAAGNITRGPFSENMPLKVMNVWTFAEEDARTTLTFTGWPHDANDAERAYYAALHDSMRQGYGATLDQLAAYLVSIK